MAARAVATRFAGEREEFFVSTIRAMETGEALSEITATVKFLHDFDGFGAERTVRFAINGFVFVLKIVPAMMNNLPEW